MDVPLEALLTSNNGQKAFGPEHGGDLLQQLQTFLEGVEGGGDKLRANRNVLLRRLEQIFWGAIHVRQIVFKYQY